VIAMRRALILAAIFIVFATARAHAGAWTVEEGAVQTITTTTISNASKAYDASGKATEPVRYNKVLTQAYIEYGLRNYVTVFAAPEYARARSGAPGGPVKGASAAAIATGARVRLMKDHGVLSLEGSYKTAGAFDTSVSVNQESGRQFELRLLYGTNFSLFGHEGFADFEIGQRWIAGARPDETPLDVTLGYRPWRGGTILLQSFNIVAAGNGRPPYRYYRSHKLSASLVQRIYRSTSVQIGGFFSPAGQGALDEAGFSFAVWESC
jgi:hypothetical protein